MKKLLLSLLITLISSTFAFSQSKVIDYSSKIPTELKVKYSSQLNIETFSEYSRKHEGTIVLDEVDLKAFYLNVKNLMSQMNIVQAQIKYLDKQFNNEK